MSEMHMRAMLLLKKEQSSDVCEYAPIARALHTMDPASQLKSKFGMTFIIAKEHFSFTKIKPLCELGQGYKNNQACATFVKYIALEQCQALADAPLHGKFYSIQANGSTNSANIVYLVVYVDPYASNRKVHVCNKFFIV